MLDHCLDCLFFVPDVVLLHIFNVLCVDGRDDGFDCHRIHHLLEGVLLPFDLLIFLEQKEPPPLGVFLNFLVKELRIFEAHAVEVMVSGGETYSGLGEHEREEIVLAPPFGSCEISRKGRKLIDKVPNRV